MIIFNQIESIYLHQKIFSSFMDQIRYRLVRRSKKFDSAPVYVRLKEAGDNALAIRPGTSDAQVLWDTFHEKYHLPPKDLRSGSVIVDLGANVGFTVAHFCHLYPKSKIIAVEMDKENFNLAKKNTSFCGEKCTLIHAAVWIKPGQVAYSGDDAWGFHVSNNNPEGKKIAPARTLDEIFQTYKIEIVDYLKMDIEGAEANILNGSMDWARKVKMMKVELHPDFNSNATYERCSKILEKNGFQCYKDSQYEKCLVAVK